VCTIQSYTYPPPSPRVLHVCVCTPVQVAASCQLPVVTLVEVEVNSSKLQVGRVIFSRSALKALECVYM
jgi:hypothetical protein